MRTLAVVAFFLLLPSLALADEKIGYVDVQRALNEVEDGRVARKKLKDEFDEKQRVLDEKQAELQLLQEDYKKQEMMLSAEAKQEKLNDFQRKMLELQQLYMNLQKDLSTREAEMTKGIFERMNVVLNKIAEDKGFSMILEKNESSILFARPSMDLTNELIRDYNELLRKEKKGGAKKKAKEPAKEGAPPAAKQ